MKVSGTLIRLTAGAVAIAAVSTLPALAADPIKIGVITDETGRAAFYAQLVTEGVKLAAKEINAKGGILGR